MSSRPNDVIFLFGAGASIPAGLPGIYQLTKDFEKLEISKELKEAYHFIKTVLSKKMDEKVDLEHILQALTQFQVGPRETTHYFYGQPDEELRKHQPKFSELIKYIKQHLRKELEVDFTVDYLLGLKGFTESLGKVEIFTLNYDSVIETFCEMYNIRCTDGFDLYWNPTSFKKEKGVNLYKLHGSLYWFKTENGKLVKIPVKHLETENLLYYSDEGISDESMIYPTSIKEMELIPYSYLRNRFIERLSLCDMLVVVGYSFRDKELLNIVLDKLSTNENLWLLIVDPKPDRIRNKLIKDNKELDKRIIKLPMDTQTAFGFRKLNMRVNHLQDTIAYERGYLSNISQNSWIEWYKLRELVDKYKSREHFSRIKSLAENTFMTPSDSQGPEFQTVLTLFPFSLRFGVESCVQKDWVNAELWFQIFGSLMIASEYTLARNNNLRDRYRNIFREKFGIMELPWVSGREYIASIKELEDFLKLDSKLLSRVGSDVLANLKLLLISIEKTVAWLKIRGDDPRFSEERQKVKKFIVDEGGLHYPIMRVLWSVASQLKSGESLVSSWDTTKKILLR